MKQWRWTALVATMVCAVALACPQKAAAQTVSFGNQNAWVTTSDGKEQKGRLTAFTPAGVQLRLPDGHMVTLPIDTVQRIDVRDGLGNGARNGAIAGAIFGTAVAIAWANDCEGCTDLGPFVVSAALAYTAVGAGIGVAIDALRHGRQTIYSASAPHTVAVAPIASRNAAGMRVAIQW